MTTTFPPIAIKAIDKDSFDSSSVIANRDGSLLERSEWIINALSSDPTKLTAVQSIAEPVEENSIQQFTIAIADVNQGSIPEKDINLRSMKASMLRSRDGSDFILDGITQPIFEKETGIVFCTYQFLAKEWQPKDMYKLTVNGIIANGSIPAMIWSSLITKFEDTSTKVVTIQTNLKTVADELINLIAQTDIIKSSIDTIANKQNEATYKKNDIQTNVIDNIKTIQSIQQNGVDLQTSLVTFKNELLNIISTTSINSDLLDLLNNINDKSDETIKAFDIESNKISLVDKNITKLQQSNDILKTDIIKLQTMLLSILDKLNSNENRIIIKDIKRIDSTITNIALKLESIENYKSNREYWYGENQGTHLFDQESNIGWKIETQGQNKFGKEVKLSDGMNDGYYLNRILLVVASLPNVPYRIRFYYGDNLFENASILTEVIYIKAGNLLGSVPLVMNAPLVFKDNKLWCNISCIKQASIDLLVGIKLI